MARQDSKRDRLDTLEKKLSASRQRHQPDDNQGRANANMLGLAWRLTVEMLAGIGVGGFIGWGVDRQGAWHGAYLYVAVIGARYGRRIDEFSPHGR